MNKKQLITLWVGIIIFSIVGFLAYNFKPSIRSTFGPNYNIIRLLRIFALWPVIIIVTSGLIYTFRNKTGEGK